MAGNVNGAGDDDLSRKVDIPEPDPVPTDKELGVELGVEYNLPFSVPFSDGTSQKEREARALREIMQSRGEENGPTIAQLVAMRRLDGQARALYRLLVLPIRAALAKSTFVPAEGGEEEAEFIDQVFRLPPSQGGMSVTLHRFMSQLLLGLFDGFSAFEQVYWRPAFGPLKGKYTLQKLAYRQSETITFVENEDGGFEGFRQRAYLHGKTVDIHIPKERAFYYAAQEEERKYYGVSYFQSAFYHYDKKIKMYYIAHLAAQRAAVGTRVGTFPVNATREQRQTLAQNLANLAVAQWMMVPEGTKVEMLKESGTFPFLDYINHHNNQMSKSILANFFDKDTGGGSGDAKLVSFGQPGDDMFVLMLRAIMDDIANSINHYVIPRLIDWNFEGGNYPTFQWAALTDDQKALISGTFEKLATAGEGVNVSQEFLREIEMKMAAEMGLEIDWDEVEAREEAERSAMNLTQGLDSDGNPLPKDAMGNPVMPGQDNPDQILQAFEASISKKVASETPAGEEEDEKEKVKLSQEERLLEMAGDILSLAQSERVVRTDEGSDRYNVPIGASIPEGEQQSPKGGGVTIERLMSLRSQYAEFRNAGNEAEAKKIFGELRKEVHAYTGSWSPSEFVKLMQKLDNPED